MRLVQKDSQKASASILLWSIVIAGLLCWACQDLSSKSFRDGRILGNMEGVHLRFLAHDTE